jgi:amino acid transporter
MTSQRTPAPELISASPDPAGDGLPRRLGFIPATAIVAGCIIGSGIFRVPAAVAGEVGSPAGVAVVWILGGLISLCGALSLAELAAALPRSGGVFVYLREAFGPLVAFLFGWTNLFLGPASIAAVALVFAEYLGTLVSFSPTGVRVAASVAVVAVAAGTYRSVSGVGGLMSAATGAKVAALLGLVAAAFILSDGGGGALGGGAPAAADARWGGVGLGLVAALWAYNGFQDMVSVAGEVRDPARMLPRALLAGMLIVIAVYIAANVAYLYVLPFDTLRNSPLVASDTMIHLVGSAGASAVAAMVMVSTFGTLVGGSLAFPRVSFAMAGAGLLFGPLARVHERYRTPHVAVVVHTVIALPFLWSRSFEQLVETIVLGTWPFLALAVAGVLVLRRKRPELARPYRTPGYPFVPLLFIAGTGWIIVSALLDDPATTLAGVGAILLGVPIYGVWMLTRRREGTDGSAMAAPNPAVAEVVVTAEGGP